MIVHLVQYDIAWEDKAANHAKVGAMLEEVRPVAGSLIVLPEMFSTGFSMNVEATAQKEDREDERLIAELARRHRSCVIGGVVPPASGGKSQNESIALGPDGAVLWSGDSSPATVRHT